MRFRLVILFCLLALSGYSHPLHFSITNIDFSENKAEISIKLFADDMTNHLKLNSNNSQNKIDTYIKANFKISLNNKQHKLTLKEIKSNTENIWVNYTIKIEEQPTSISIVSKLLADCFHDQNNLIIISNKGNEKGIQLNARNNWESEIAGNF